MYTVDGVRATFFDVLQPSEILRFLRGKCSFEEVGFVD